MCGIAGFTHRDWSPESDRIDRVAATILHRGPDQQGVFRSNVASLAATRLKIIDLAAGDQPIKSDDGNAVIVFNGEIYNHLELRGELEQLGHRFHSRADTETVLHAFLEWDTNCFRKLRGMFAIALWNETKQRLVLARDRMGIKPLYIARRGKDLLFGSELKAILIHPEIDRRLSMAGLSCYLSLNYVPCPWTLVDGIEKLPPGFWLEWCGGEIHSEAYWDLAFHSAAAAYDERGKRGAGFSTRASRTRTLIVGRAAGRMAERRNRFLNNPSLCRKGIRFQIKNSFDFISRPRVRRNSLHPRGCRALWDGSRTI